MRLLIAAFVAAFFLAYIPVGSPAFALDREDGLIRLAHGGGGGGDPGGDPGDPGGPGDPGEDDEADAADTDDGDDMEEARAVEGVNYCEWRLAPFLLPPLYIYFCHDYQFPAGWEFPG